VRRSLDKIGVELTVSRDTSVPCASRVPKGSGALGMGDQPDSQCREGRPMPKRKPGNRRVREVKERWERC